MIQLFLMLFVFALLGAALGFIGGISFVLAGGVYVNRYGAIDIRWPPKRTKRR